MSEIRSSLTLYCLMAAVLCAGCSHPAAWHAEPDFHVEAGVVGPAAVTAYDTTGDGRMDYLQVHDDKGVKRQLLFDTDGDGSFDLAVDQSEPNQADCRTLLFLLDGISYDLVADLWAEGRFRLFPAPTHVIPGWPTVTDNIYADFFETPRPFGVEALYFDRQANRMAGGIRFYLQGGNERVWPRHMLWRQDYMFDGIVYGLPGWTAGRELDKTVGAAIRWLERSDEPYAAIYIVSTDALGHKLGHEALRRFLLRVDEAIEQLVWRAHGRLRVLCMADHALNEATMRRTPILKTLCDEGFHIRERIDGPRDVVVPDYGLVSVVAMYTDSPAEAAAAAVKAEGVELAVYPEDGAWMVASPGGMACVETNRHGRYRYVAEQGDPLALLPVLELLRLDGKADAEGWAPADAWLDATWDHVFPDPLVRIAGAFAGNVDCPPDVLLSLAPTHYFGEDEFDVFATLRGTHGALRRCTTTTYALANFIELPQYLRTTELRDMVKQRLGRDTLLPPARR